MENLISDDSVGKKPPRAGLMDEVRGFCILCMVFYHVMFDLNYTYGIHIPFMFDDWFDVIRDIFAGMFMFICGMSCRYSRNNAKRGIQCFFIGMVITFVFAFFSPEAPIVFGILHFFGISMMIYGIWDKYILKIPAKIGIGICVFMFLLTRGIVYGYLGPFKEFSIPLPDLIYNVKLLFPFGFIAPGFVSMDYFPLFPWLFVVIAGAYFGEYAVNGKLPAFFYNTHCKPLAFCGRITLWIYVLHQPVAMMFFLLIFGYV